MSAPVELWRRYDAMENRLSAVLTERMLDRAELRPGARVLDLASGRGEPAIPAAHRVGPGGRVTAVDRDPSVLALAAERAEREGVRLDLFAADCETLEGVPAGPFDAALVRWGLLYFSEPRLALRSVRPRLAPGRPLVVAVWAEPERVDYYQLPRDVLARLTPRAAPADLGPFRYARHGSLEADLEGCGFAVRRVEELYVPVAEGDTPDALIAWTRAFGLDRLLAEHPPELALRWEEEMRIVLLERARAGPLRLGGVSRVVTAVAA